MEAEMKKEFEQINRRFNSIDQRFDKKIDDLALCVKAGFDEVDIKFNEINGRLDATNERIDVCNEHIDANTTEIKRCHSRLDDFVDFHQCLDSTVTLNRSQHDRLERRVERLEARLL